MNKHLNHTIPVLLISVFLLSGCNLPLPGSTRPTTTPTLFGGLESSPTPAVSPTPELVLTASANDPCLQGVWVMDHESFNELLRTLLPIPNISSPSGTLSLSFYDPAFIYAADALVLRMDTGSGNYIQVTGGVSSSGSYSTADGMLVFNTTSSSSDFTRWEAMIDGVLTDYPGTPQAIHFSLPGGGTYVCESNTLTVDTTGTANTPNPLHFERVDGS